MAKAETALAKGTEVHNKTSRQVSPFEYEIACRRWELSCCSPPCYHMITYLSAACRGPPAGTKQQNEASQSVSAARQSSASLHGEAKLFSFRWPKARATRCHSHPKSNEMARIFNHFQSPWPALSGFAPAVLCRDRAMQGALKASGLAQ